MIVDSAEIIDRDPTVLYMWTVYKQPRDYPHTYVARLWKVMAGGVTEATDTVMISMTLDTIRKSMIRAGFYRLDRFPQDEPQIVELWI